jgi:hypothetical protein
MRRNTLMHSLPCFRALDGMLASSLILVIQHDTFVTFDFHCMANNPLTQDEMVSNQLSRTHGVIGVM